ncbi:MAG: long-chain fatty acid--CoA ligase [Hyphomicrobiales bacterium]|nr:long-chain fatty acid--CoA ligase [Hyphomicrobiales bacterium]
MAKTTKTAAISTSAKGKADAMPWLDHYPEQVIWNDKLDPQSLPDMFDEAVKAHGDRKCTNFLGAELTYREIAGQVDRLAAGLQARGLGRGHRIGLFLPNAPYYVVAYYAILKIGAVVVNFNPLYTIEELDIQARDAGVVAMITLDLKLLFDKIAALMDTGVLETAVVCPFTDILPPFTRVLFKLFKGKDIADTHAPRSHGEIIHWADITNNDGKYEPAIIKAAEDTALLQYTGGTTGIPKGAMLSHANLTINVQQIIAWSSSLGLARERVMGILPFFHVFAMTTVLNFGVKTGSTMILMPKFELDQAIKLIRKHKPTILPGVPTLYNALLNHQGIKQEDLSSLKLCISGGAPLPHEIRTRFEAFSGCKVVEGYGLSETSPVATVNPIVGLEKDSSIGQPVPQTHISIRSLEDPKKQMPQGETGEICIKGPQVMQGYWNNSDATDAVMIGEYFRTGDVGYMDEFGFTYIIDRIKDMINCSGYKVYPRRIEDAIYQLDAIEEVTVIGIPDEYRGEAPKAFIKLKQGRDATADEILTHLTSKISKIEMPEEIEFRDELPKTMVGKLSKKELRERTD